MARIAGTMRHRSVVSKPFGPASKEAPPQGLYGASGLGDRQESNLRHTGEGHVAFDFSARLCPAPVVLPAELRSPCLPGIRTGEMGFLYYGLSRYRTMLMITEVSRYLTVSAPSTQFTVSFILYPIG